VTVRKATPRRWRLWFIYLLLAPLALGRHLRRRRAGWIAPERKR
jgi:hypothetical protein